MKTTMRTQVQTCVSTEIELTGEDIVRALRLSGLAANIPGDAHVELVHISCDGESAVNEQNPLLLKWRTEKPEEV